MEEKSFLGLLSFHKHFQTHSITTLIILKLYIQFSSVTQSCLSHYNPMDCSTLGFPVHHQLLEFAQTHVHQVSDAIQPFHPLLSPSPPAFNLSSIRVFSSESVHHIRWPKYWEFQLQHHPSNEYSGLITFRIDWLDLLAIQAVFSNTTAQTYQFLGTQLSLYSNSHIHMTTGKTIALTRWNLVGKTLDL